MQFGLVYFGKRFYSPNLNRFVSPDPLALHGLSADLNLYAYVHGDVFRDFDPLGLTPPIARQLPPSPEHVASEFKDAASAIASLFTTNAGPPRPLTTTRLREIAKEDGIGAGQTGIQFNRAVGVAFETFVLSHMPGPSYIPKNGTTYTSVERGIKNAAQGGMPTGVIPDGVFSVFHGVRNPNDPTPQVVRYEESAFIEVKAVKGTIGLDYGKWQILGMLDALSKSSAASSRGLTRAYPEITFVTTQDTVIGGDVLAEATKRNILVWEASVVEIPQKDASSKLMVLPAVCKNCLDLGVGQTPGVAPGIPGKLQQASPSANPLDQATLDDKVVGGGSPGDEKPGNTEPNQ